MEISEALNQLTNQIQAKLNQALGSLTHQEIKIALKQSGVIPITEIHKLLNTPDQTATSIYIPIMGDVTGDIFLFLYNQSGQRVADMMLGQPLDTTKLIGDFEGSALKEMGNITTGVIITEMANFLKMSMMLTVPNLATDMATALVDQVLIEYGATAPDLLAVEMPFTIDAIQSSGSFLLLFDRTSSDLITSKLSTATPAEVNV